MSKKLTGLSSEQVIERKNRGLINHYDDHGSRRLIDILHSNILTPFNALITVLAVIVMVVHASPINSLFFIAMVLNAAIGIGQELKAKLILDKLAFVIKPHAKVIRDGVEIEILAKDIVQDDLIIVNIGDQVVVDGEVVETNGLEIDESLLTGESDPIVKQEKDSVLSGSIVVAGSGVVRATAVGALSYSAKLAREAKVFKRASSELIEATNTIMKWIARIMIVVAPVLVIGQLRISNGDWVDATIHVVAAIVGMIPEGLVLLTSAAFMLATIKLARKKVLVQQLPAVETLARVDTLLLDKTGTITMGQIEYSHLVNLTNITNEKLVAEILATIASRSSSPTNDALKKKFAKPAKFTREIPFNSARKWSAIEINDTMFVLGAPEIILSKNKKHLSTAQKLASDGWRVLALVELDKWPDVMDDIEKLNSKPLSLVVLQEKIRPDAAETLRFFAKQGVDVKVISGDSPQTVEAVAKQVGINAKVMDARNLPDWREDPQGFLAQVREHNVFGRVLPEQKRQIAAVLQDSGKVVAMTGDGVNDALALKKADLGIAMNSGSSATKSVAELVLMDDKFSHLPTVLSEGRRVVANIERVSNLFLIKNVYVAVLALSVTALGLTYPFLPAQMTVISSLSIGIPAFFLALAPNDRKYVPGFLRRVLSFAIPTGIITALAMIIGYYLINAHGNNLTVSGTSASIIAMIIGAAVLLYLSRPIKWWKLLLIFICGTAFVLYLCTPFLARIFSLQLDLMTMPIVMIVAIGAISLILLVQIVNRKINSQ